MHPQNGMPSPRVDTPSCRHDCLFEMDWSLHSVSIRQGWLHVKELFSRTPPCVEHDHGRRSCRRSTRVDIREKTREALKACPFRAGQEANHRSTGSPQRLFSSVWGGLKQGDRDSMDPPRFFGRWLRPAPCCPCVIENSTRSPSLSVLNPSPSIAE